MSEDLQRAYQDWTDARNRASGLNADDRRAALVERVRDIIAGSGNCDRWCEGSVNPHCGCRDDANEATKIIRAETLEEAARVVDPEVLDYSIEHIIRAEQAAAIRALKEK
jgi:hypothetical protein